MAPLGPWPPDRRVAVGVSGGADSLALALLVRRWAGTPPLAIVVDHGLRPEAAAEAAATVALLETRLGCRARLLGVDPPLRPPATQEEARDARFAAFARALAADGQLDLLLGHHREDQAETIALRRAAGSGPDGLAGMSPIRELAGFRVVRPLLGSGRGRLRATLRAAGVPWLDDPANRDPRYARARLRGPGGHQGREGDARAASRAAAVDEVAGFLARHACLREDGIALLDVDAVPPGVLSALVRAVGGTPYPPRTRAIARLAPALRPATLAGVRIARAPRRLGAAFALAREEAALAGPVALEAGALWDRRFRAGRHTPARSGWTLGALGRAGAARLRDRSPLSAALLATVPAIRDGAGTVRVAPTLEAGTAASAHNFRVTLSPANPAVPSFFMFGRHLDVASDT